MNRTRLASGEMTGQHSNQLNYRSFLFREGKDMSFEFLRKTFLDKA